MGCLGSWCVPVPVLVSLGDLLRVNACTTESGVLRGVWGGNARWVHACAMQTAVQTGWWRQTEQFRANLSSSGPSCRWAALEDNPKPAWSVQILAPR